MGLMSWLTGVDLAEEQRRSDDADARLRELNAAHWAQGRLTDEELAERDARIVAGTLNVDAEVSAAAREGLAEGYARTTGAIKDTIAAPFRFTFAIIPWQVWLAAGIWGAWKLGFLDKVLKR